MRSTTSLSTVTGSSRGTLSSIPWRCLFRPAWRRAAATGSRPSKGSRRSRHELPGVSTILGLSNVSFGLNPAARHVLNSMFLHECVEAGLDAAIVHAGRIIPLSRIDERAREVCLDLIYDRRTDGYDPLSELLEIFEGATASTAQREDRSGWPVERRLELRIVDGDSNGLEDDLAEALERRARQLFRS